MTTFFPGYPHQPNPHLPPAEGTAGCWPREPACLRGNPGSRCGCQDGDSDCNTQAPATSVSVTLFLPGSSRKEKAVAHSLHSHSHSQAQKTLMKPGPATLLHRSMRSPPETNPIQDELLIAALENQLSNLKQHLQLERLA